MSEEVFTVIGAIASREVDRHQRRIIGITVTAPEFRSVDENGALEYMCDVRVGSNETWEIVKDVIIAQMAVGIVTDVNVPVTMERSEAGRLTIIARSEVRLPDIVLDRFSYNELDFVFMTNVEKVDGVWQDGYGYPATDPTTEKGSSETCTTDTRYVGWGDTDFVYDTPENGGTEWGEVVTEKICS